ncbi:MULTISPECIES: MBL fold metallo-hydrolase [Metabacillus]|uniref:MBL fold metallo-hydrolase n=1 Tax=Metabacillus rhizolycopersici TaxID=2875709 RepID=A0ABS7US74_9BACI|nr:MULTISPECIES: MBL fold metallo-hydrolase [Metabacillus]MBZ5751138.1 MBL fold metallo-hydrolase [Metabacillus rhizolycopersici]MCM3651431.1 MBL fold metallo-hydrolase [Metabacillus litoralis]
MNIQQIRNATLVVQYAGKKFLIDPMLAEKGTYPPFPNSLRQDQFNPLASLPTSIANIIHDIDAVIVTHLHLDHFDDAAKEVLPKDIKMFVQNEEDAKEVKNAGFQNIEVLQEDTVFEGIQLIKTKGEHGSGEILKIAGLVCGVVFKHPNEKTLYIAGDTVWYEAVQEVIETHKPEIIVVNGGDNQFLEGGSLVMGKDDIYQVYKAAPNAKIISVHMEAVNHWTLSREELKSFSNEKGISSNILVPDDGESYTF